MARPALIDRTNVPTIPAHTNSHNHKHSNTNNNKANSISRKRARVPDNSEVENEREAAWKWSEDADMDVDVDVDDTPVKKAVVELVEEMPVAKPRRLPGIMGMPALLAHARAGGRIQAHHLPTHPILTSLVSSHKTDVFRFPSMREDRPFAPPFGVAFTNESRRGGTPLLATATEEGTVELMSAAPREPWDPLPQRTTLTPHTNAIFSLAFSNDDRLLATASGDRTTAITDVRTHQTLHTLVGHGGSVKQVVWDPHNRNLLATGARDGRIHFWDLRLPSPTPVETIADAHLPKPSPTKGRKKHAKFAPNQSVTSLLYLPWREGMVLSAGSADGVLKLWDVRNVGGPCDVSHDPTVLPPLAPLDSNGSSPARRPRGITSLALAGADNDRVFALGTDSRIHTYSPLSLSHPPTDAPLSHPGFTANSFYIKLAASPCGRFLASGSSGGSVFVWDVLSRGPGVELRGHEKECGSVAWMDGGLASGGDDGCVRVWRADVGRRRRCLADEAEERWNWSWAVWGRGQME